MDYLFRIKKNIPGIDKELVIIFLPTLGSIIDNTMRFEDGTILRFKSMIRSSDLSSELEWVILEPSLGVTDTFLLIKESCINIQDFKVHSGRDVLDKLINENLYASMAAYVTLKKEEYADQKETDLLSNFEDLLSEMTRESNLSNVNKKRKFWERFKKN